MNQDKLSNDNFECRIDSFLRKNHWIFKEYSGQWVAISVLQEKVVAVANSRNALAKEIARITYGHKYYVPGDFIAALPTDVYRNKMLN